ncbi:MAG: FtsX-like permease family protein [Candidatus Thermoplasmatota archaeon]|jgi:putative ABC transport system permease protein|nr:FtsX-like permease family protein [Candidatus Thermoplasmatota archaeon]
MNMFQIIIALAIALSVSVGLLALKHRVICKLALRNINRRRKTSILIIMGLMIGTALISSSMVIQDTMYYTFRKVAYDHLGEIDETITSTDSNGTYLFFDYSVYEIVSKELKRGDHGNIDGIAPQIQLLLPVYDVNRDLAEPNALIVGFNATIERDFGTEENSFQTSRGGKIDGSGLNENEIIMNELCAEELEAQTNDKIIIYYGQIELNFTIRNIVENTGLANFNEKPMIFLRLDTLQDRLELGNKINFIKISNRGGVEDGNTYSENVREELLTVIELKTNSTVELEVELAKQNALDKAREISEFMGDVFTIMGAFVVVAGLVLVILIFVMLAEERRTEMGIARAIGMSRNKLMFSFLFEGFIYSIIAVIIGSVAGLAISYIILYLLEMRAEMIFYFENSSILLSMGLGLVSTVLMIILSSWMISKINIVRAVRKIPEPMKRGQKRILLPISLLLIVTGIILTVIGIIRHLDTDVHSDLILVWGPVVAALGITCSLFIYLSPRLLFSLVGITMVFWALNPFMVYKGTGPEMFISSGLVLVPGGVLLFVFNSDFFLSGLSRLFGMGKKRKNLPAIRIGISYPMKKRFRTGMILIIFTMVIFATSVEAIFTHLEIESVRRAPEKQAGGYDLVCTINPLSPINNLSERLGNSEKIDMTNFNEFTPITTINTMVRKHDGDGDTIYVPYPILGFGKDFIENNSYTFLEHDPRYEKPKDVWKAVGSDASLAVIDRSVAEVEWDPFFGPFTAGIGDIISVLTRNGNYTNVTLIGILDLFMVPGSLGIYISQDFVRSNFGYVNENMYLVDLAEGADVKEQSRLLEREFMLNGMEAKVIMDDVNMMLNAEKSIVTLMQGYMAVGLVVGIAGLGIITIRSVVERRREIGIVRSIGFTRKMVIKSFLIENIFVVGVSCILGIVMAIGIGYKVYLKMFLGDVPFLLPWLTFLVFSIIALFGTTITSIPPGRKAASIPPAEATRYLE